MKPGSTLFIRTPSAAYFVLNILANAARPARKTADVGKSASGSNTANVEMLTIDPSAHDPCS